MLARDRSTINQRDRARRKTIERVPMSASSVHQHQTSIKNGNGSCVGPTTDLEGLFQDLHLTIEYVPVTSLKRYKRALRQHSPEHIQQLAASLQAFGFVTPIIIDA